MTLSVLEAAALSGLGESTIRDMLEDKRLPHKRVGRRILIQRKDVMAAIEPDQPAH